jgi:hypothetical protein
MDEAQLPELERGEVLSAISALLLLIAVFALKWFGVDGIPGRSAATSTENAWHALTLGRWLILLTVVVCVGSVLLHLSQRSHGAKTNTSLAVSALATLTLALLVYRVLIDLPAADRVVDQKLGAFVGLAFAFGAALGGYDAVRAERSHPRLAVRRPRRMRERVETSRAAR